MGNLCSRNMAFDICHEKEEDGSGEEGIILQLGKVRSPPYSVPHLTFGMLI